MIANYHTHTPRCRHAGGTEEEYIQVALETGLQTLGFSDHTPYWFPGSYYSTMRMYPQELPDYCDTVRALQKKYADKLRIHLGLEVEYYPAFFRDLLPRLRDQGVEYMLLGQHWIGSEIGEPYAGGATTDEGILRRYCDQVIEAMETGLFTYLAHPDLVRYEGSEKIYRRHMGRLCQAAKVCGMPLEINMLGLNQGRHYPNEAFWRIAAEEGCPVVIGADAHEPWMLNNPVQEARALKLVETYSLPLLETVTLKKL